MGDFDNAVIRSLELGIDPSRDVALAGCRCGPEGHALLTLAFARQAAGPNSDSRVWNNDLTVPRPTLLRLRAAGLAFILSGREGGWPASWWAAQATPAGLRHAAQFAGLEDQHGSACGGRWDAAGHCARCGDWRPLTIELDQRYLASLPAGETREQESWASQFVCPYHGRTRLALVRTDKCCARCGTGLLRRTPVA